MRLLSRSILPVILIATGMMLLAARGFALGPADEERDLAKIRKRAEMGFVQQQVELAAAYLAGRGVTQDAVQAAHWYLKAAESGDPWAENEIGYLYEAGIGVQKDLERAFHWFQLAATSGMPLAKVNLGVSYYRGSGVRADSAMARALFREATEKGAGSGANFLGVMDLLGLGGPVNHASAEQWFELGAKLHDPEAAYNLACLFSKANDQPQLLRRAADLLRQASGRGYLPARHLLGLLLVRHPELALPSEQGRLLLVEASNEGSWKSSIILGVLARDGKGASPDPAQAWYYFRLAVLQGGSATQSVVAPDLKALESKLSIQQQVAMSARANDWFDQHRASAGLVFDDADSAHNYPLVARSITE